MARRAAAPSDLLTTAEAARVLHMHVKRVQLLARQGQLVTVRHGRRWLFPRESLMRGRVPVQTDAGAIDISARNQLRGRVRSVRVDGLMAEVTLRIDQQSLVALITRSSAERLGLVPGADAIAVVKSTEVMVARRTGR